MANIQNSQPEPSSVPNQPDPSLVDHVIRGVEPSFVPDSSDSTLISKNQFSES